MEKTMLRINERRSQGQPTNLGSNVGAGSIVPDEPRRRRDGSIDYDFYRACARRLRQECVTDSMRALARHAVRGLITFAGWIVASIESRASARAAAGHRSLRRYRT
jgi:hypothetical protein